MGGNVEVSLVSCQGFWELRPECNFLGGMSTVVFIVLHVNPSSHSVSPAGGEGHSVGEDKWYVKLDRW
ncbi:hypothetical protein MHYP_G00232790 [Metynnis hypsauchen]